VPRSIFNGEAILNKKGRRRNLSPYSFVAWAKQAQPARAVGDVFAIQRGLIERRSRDRSVTIFVSRKNLGSRHHSHRHDRSAHKNLSIVKNTAARRYLPVNILRFTQI
jgi:hypothetical protein